jgi:sorbitol-specific phosphotransferase system component IIA
MNDLTSTELRVMNGITTNLNTNVNLGNTIQEIIGHLVKEGTPVNASSANATLSVSGVVVDGETVSIGDNVYEFVADVAKTVSEGNFPVDISDNTTASYGSLTMDVQPISGDTVTIGEKMYIFVPVGTDTADAEVSIGASLLDAQANIIAAINGTDGISDPHPLVSAGAFSANVCTITALIGGTAGNLIATTETFTSPSNIFGAATLGSGISPLEKTLFLVRIGIRLLLFRCKEGVIYLCIIIVLPITAF